MEEDILAVADGGDFFDGENDASFVVGPHDGNQGGVGADGFVEQMQIERAVGVHGEESHFAALLLEEGAMIDDGGMLDGGGQDVAAAGMGGQGAVQGGVVAFGAATGEDDFLGVGIEEGGDFGAGLLDFVAGLAAEFVDAGRVAVVVAQEGQHGVNDFRGHAGGGVVVEIIDFLLAHNCRKRPALNLMAAIYRAVAASSRKCGAGRRALGAFYILGQPTAS